MVILPVVGFTVTQVGTELKSAMTPEYSIVTVVKASQTTEAVNYVIEKVLIKPSLYFKVVEDCFTLSKTNGTYLHQLLIDENLAGTRST